MIIKEENPLITFAVIGYCQEVFIREAVTGAFLQTYKPLQIILSDDSSADQTFAIMEKMAFEYKGPHMVTLNRNQHNLGLGAHINRVMELAQGELVVVAAGDDISEPDRVQKVWKAWENSGRQAHSIYSGLLVMDEAGRKGGVVGNPPPSLAGLDLLRAYLRREFTVNGAAHAWSRQVFDIFGPLPDGLRAEERAIATRSILLGGIAYIDEPLVRYRRNSASITAGYTRTTPVQRWRDDLARQVENLRVVCGNLLTILPRIKISMLGAEAVIRESLLYEELLLCLSRGSLKQRLSATIRASRNKVPVWRAIVQTYRKYRGCMKAILLKKQTEHWDKYLPKSNVNSSDVSS